MSSGREVEPEMSDSELDPTADNQWVDEMLQDPAKKAFLLRKLGLEDWAPSRQRRAIPPLIAVVGRMVVDLPALSFPRPLVGRLWDLDQVA